MHPHVYLHALNTIPTFGSSKIRSLIHQFGTPEAVWKTSQHMLLEAGLQEKTIDRFLDSRNKIHPEEKWEQLEKHNITLLVETDPNYPSLLTEIPHPPYILYRRGEADLNNLPLITLVGSRRCTPYGKRVAYQLAKDFVQAGIGVVSGLALGIDAASHEGALHAQGLTIAVLGNSLDDHSIAPRSNFALAQSILSHSGALLSEYPPVTSASPYTFPARNRIMAGMTLGTVVVESTEKSGTLITAQMALEYNREVFAVPGSIFSEASSGPNHLIRSGAKIVTSVADVLEELNLSSHPKSSTSAASENLSPEEAALLRLLSHEPLHIDNILKATTLDTSRANSTLTLLELKGLAKNIGAMTYIKL